MTDTEKRTIKETINRLETKIDTYKRQAERTRRQAYIDDEYGYHESAKFNKGQQFALEYVINDLQITVDILKNI